MEVVFLSNPLGANKLDSLSKDTPDMEMIGRKTKGTKYVVSEDREYKKGEGSLYC
jgi:hypothetical protein